MRQDRAPRGRRPPTVGRRSRARDARPVSLSGRGTDPVYYRGRSHLGRITCSGRGCRPEPSGTQLADADSGSPGAGVLGAPARVALTVSAVHWSTPNIIGVDGYYHIKMAEILRQQGWRMLLPLEFPWLPTTVLNPADFTNHHLLFHLLLAPFTLLDLRIGAKLSAVVFATAALMTAYQIMAEHRIRFAPLWLLVMLSAAGPFLYRLSMTRRQSLTLCLLLLALYLAFSGRRRWLLPLGFAFSWLFDGFPLLLGVCGAAFLGEWWQTRRPHWGLLLYPAAGVALGTLIHPHFPNNLWFSYLHMQPKLLQLFGLRETEAVIRVGNEWYPYSTDFLLSANWLALLLPVLGLVPILLDPRPARLRAIDGKVIALGIVAVTFLLLFLRSRRWIEAEPAFAVLFCAFAWNRALPEWAHDRLRMRLPSGAAMLVAVAAAALVAPLFYRSVTTAIADVRSTRDYLQYRDAARWLAQNTPPGARVFATDWDDFPELFFWNTHNVYLVGLDPTYMYLHDGPLYLRWRDITRGRVERPSSAIRDEFDSGFVFSDLAHDAFLRHAAADPGMVEVFRSKNAVVFRVEGWRATPSTE